MVSGGQVWFDGELIDYGDATMHVLAHATQRGTAVFDVIKVVPTDSGSAALGLAEHATRFMNSMDLMGMEPTVTAATLEAATAEVVAANPGTVVIKMVAAWKEVPLRALPLTPVPSIWIAAMGPFTDTGSESEAVTGEAPASVSLMTASAPKMPANILPPSLKVAASYTVGVRERMKAVSSDFDDVIFRSSTGGLAEGTTQSVFVVAGGKVLVPPLDSVLDGITRRMVLEVAAHAGVEVEVRSIEWSEVTAADELFVASTNLPVVPVNRHDERVLDAPGPVTDLLRSEVLAVLAGSHDLSAQWLTEL